MGLAPVLEAVFGQLSDGVCLSDGGRVQYMNPAATRMLGARPPEEETRGICELLCARLSSPEKAECASSCPLRDPADPRTAVTFEGRLGLPPVFRWNELDVRRVEARRPLRARCLRLPGTGHDGVEGLHLTLIEDASAEAELRRRQEDWRSMVVHDLRAPLANVFGALRVLQDEEKEGAAAREERAQSLAIAVRNCRRVMDLLDVYLALARMDAGAMPVQDLAVRLDGVARAVADELSSLAAERGLRVELDVPADAVARGDPELLERVVQNLLHNALKFSPDGGVVLVRARRGSERVELSVSNGGPAIAQERRASLFQRFGRGAPRAPGQGAGLGLAFCREALAAMGGSIELAEGGEGATFRVLLRAD
jgi:signal transduction histidine kinase